MLESNADKNSSGTFNLDNVPDLSVELIFTHNILFANKNTNVSAAFS